VQTTALLLVAASALLHAVWNLLLKKARDRVAFVWWYLLVPLVLFSPAALLSTGGWEAATALRSVGCGVASGVLQAACLLAMALAYEHGDLSAAYPLSRGAAQILIVALGMALLRERVSALGFGAIGLMVAGVYVAFLPSLSRGALFEPLRALSHRSARAALGAGLAIALYHLIDRVGVQGANQVHYVLLLFAADLCTVTLFIAFHHHWERVRAEWRLNRRSIVVAGVSSLISYLLVLYALSRERVTYVGPARNLGIVFSVVLGALVLGERHTPMRLAGSVLIITGIAVAAAAG